MFPLLLNQDFVIFNSSEFLSYWYLNKSQPWGNLWVFEETEKISMTTMHALTNENTD